MEHHYLRSKSVKFNELNYDPLFIFLKLHFRNNHCLCVIFLHQTVSVECHDNGNPSLSISQNVSVEIADVNEAPFNIRLNASAVVQENVQVGYIIGDLTCKDPDIGQGHVFTVLGNYSSVFQVSRVCYLM